ncbi:hypothetical protein Rahaq_0146 [Rahnella aceris]|uniref:Uncharacterized protein n=1 Tax=Rahnella sp. (strain Y9602) TaxID=2703885 RepID=A0A0H3F9H3_RAHSY|nr:hypothetical protein Rahaq_0146 [Rahnella aceris]
MNLQKQVHDSSTVLRRRSYKPGHDLCGLSRATLLNPSFL